MIVMKFGGTSLADAACLRQVAALLAEPSSQPCVAVVSAASGVTDLLLATGQLAAAGAEGEVEANLSRLRQREHNMASEGIKEETLRSEVVAEVDALLASLARVCTGVTLLGELSPRSQDLIASFGEKLSATLLAGVLRDRGIRASAISTEGLVVTDEVFGAASPLMAPTTRNLRARLLPMLEQGIVPVLTGFIGSTAEGVTTTLGRGGSDYSASLVGSSLDADEVWIWTDVDGVMTADPRLVPSAQSLPEVSYAEAAELSYFGAKVIHPRTVIPTVEKGIPLRVKNTFNPGFPGTLIHQVGSPAEHVVKAITSIRNLSLVSVEGAGMMGVPGVAARVFGAVARRNVSVLMISQASSEHSICFVVPEAAAEAVVRDLKEELARELERGDISSIHARQGAVIVAAVGEGMRGTLGVAGRLFSALGRAGVNVMAIAQGSSELNISLVVDGSAERAAVAAIHEEFIG